ncbi:NEDD8-activating enzyme E1 regulatory subunit [Neolecta irregularis DAH-3]|uniref:NEDD8-activating enzyme E1 regulatory subunit n=1 Tax=Neolecta irregularis (strain DAH-3) TaxID=1198029 RepID=A0A1U7LTT5_NEOID|nr:NEDD8-activating enzyme E1 regulatory subunit [Neolecta irregularis DAH-3]|eukprot:OLL26080.1 NEDD8-activating enzyme E1 regulatory subunit [Neolecta irregularis DAH-3]
MVMDANHSLKYDRQLRLWAANGQSALEKSRICLINGSAVGSEALKNLVLPGIGSFVIIDNKFVLEEDTGVNFFVDVMSIGKPRASTIVQHLLELNDEVKGKAILEDPLELIAKQPEFFKDFTVVIATDLSATILLPLSKVLWVAGIPLFVAKSVGFMAYLRIAVPEITLVETHPDSLVDLRLDSPWPELRQFADTLRLEEMNGQEHSHVPYIALLIKLVQEWKNENNGNTPSTSAEKQEFKEFINSKKLTPDEENFDEAINQARKACVKTEIPKHVKVLLNDPQAQNLTPNSSNFWILVRSLADFVAATGFLPLSGVLPDMKADSSRYVLLQNIYHQKAQCDISQVKSYIHKHLTVLKESIDRIEDQEIEVFCKHAAYLKVIQYRSLEQEYTTPNTKRIAELFEDGDNLIPQYVTLRAYDLFVEKNGHAPGKLIERIEQDTTELQEIAADIMGQCGLAMTDLIQKHCAETTRAGGAELHNISSFLGGLVAQEVIKVVTRQYVTFNNTCIFDAIKSRTIVLEM